MQQNEIAGKLTSIMENLLATYYELETIGLEKRKILADGDINLLRDIVDREEKIACAVMSLEQTLKAAGGSQQPSLRQVILMLDEPIRTNLLELLEKLNSVMQSVKLINSINSEIIDHLLCFLNYEFSLISGPITPHVYGTGGCDSQPGPSRILIDRKI